MHRNVNTHFNSNPVSLDMPRSKFNRDHSVKFSAHHGTLIPFYCDEILPGDTVDITTSKLIRTLPLVAPIMDETFLDVYYFYVPNRLIFEKFLEFMGEATEDTTVDPGQIVGQDITIPQIGFPSSNGTAFGVKKPFDVHSLFDYFGLPVTHFTGNATFNALPLRAYQKIYNDWFRSESMENPVPTFYKSTAIHYPPSSFQQPIRTFGIQGFPFQVNKTFDYFTSCLKSPQRGPDVSLAVPGGKLPVYYGAQDNPLLAPGAVWNDYVGSESGRNPIRGAAKFVIKNSTGDAFTRPSTSHMVGYDDTGEQASLTVKTSGGTSVNDVTNFRDAFISNMQVDFEGAFMTINQLREAFAVQRYYEKLNRSGSRYISQVQAFFGVTSPDARLQRSEYLGGTRIYLDINQVAQTSSTDTISPQGNLSGISATSDVHSDVHKSFYEHGYILGLCCFRNHHSYGQGVDRMFFKKTLFDFYNPTFANIGEQPVYKRELYFTDDDGYNDSVFGYNEAWADYRYRNSVSRGLMRPDVDGSLAVWHLGDYYTEKVYLGDGWLKETNANMNRVMAVESEPEYICDFYLKSTWTRVMPLYSVPGLIDHH